MRRRVLLDSNLLIGAFEPMPDNSAHEAAKALFRQLMGDDDVDVFITPLIRYEVLRGVRRISQADMEEKLNAIQEIPVREKEANRAAELFHLAREKGLFQSGKDEKDACPVCGYFPLNKHSFDLFHCACADAHGMRVASQDDHIQKIQKLIQDSKQNAQT
ncbi:hypothetical protein AGMMS49545_02570 [Betaproteobacteria bacterium]|nr:hypothetical protein AGMMS49545_02570 [Betaproteobacteria bacterium]GHU40269.1 hypothetical protein AGMMS50289_01540 [Betaproteobacteria bacterium]